MSDVSVIVTGVVGLAGIGGALWQARLGWGREDRRAKVAEKRRIYVNCIAAFNAGKDAAAHKKDLRDTPQGSAATSEHIAAISACLAAVYELTLIAPSDVHKVSVEVLRAINEFQEDPGPITRGLVDLVAAMRADLGELPL